MDFTSSVFERHIHKFLVILSIAALIGLFRHCRRPALKRDVSVNTEDAMMQLANARTIEEVQRFIEQMPCDCTEEELRNANLADLVDELVKWSDDESWQALVKSIEVEDAGGRDGGCVKCTT